MANFKIGDVLDYIQPTKYIVLSSIYSNKYDIPVLTPGDSFILGYTNEKIGVYKASKNNPVILFDDFTTSIKWVDFPFKVKSSACKILVPRKNCNMRYMYYLMKYINFDHSQHKRYWISEYSKIEIKQKQYEIQEHIVEVLDHINNLINSKYYEINYLDQLIKSRFIEMFENKGFPLSTIGKTCVLKSGKTFSKELEQSFGDILYIKVSDMNLSGNEKYITTSKTFVSKHIAGKTIIPTNSVIFPKRGGAIGTNKKRINQCEICIDLNTMAVTPKAGLNIQYLYQYFLNIDMGTLYNGSSVPQINNKDIEPLTIIIPPIELQNEFAEFVKLIDKSKFIVQQQIKELQELLDSKMDEYFR